jgi:hypothetical protein
MTLSGLPVTWLILTVLLTLTPKIVHLGRSARADVALAGVKVPLQRMRQVPLTVTVAPLRMRKSL